MKNKTRLTAVRRRKNLHVAEVPAPMDLQPYTIYLHTSPHIQTAAIAHLAVNVQYTGDEPDCDTFSEKAGQALDDCCSVMGIAEDSPLAVDVQDVVMELSYKMHDALVKAGLLRPDCEKAWQAEKVGRREEGVAQVQKVA